MKKDLMEHTVRDHKISIRLTDREYRVLKTLSIDNKKSLSGFIRDIMLPMDVKEIREMLEED